MSLKSKGINGERELVHRFWAAGWACIRVAGSGSSKYPSPDLLAGNVRRKLAIECKVTSGDSKYLEKDDVIQIRTFAQAFGAEPWIAIKIARQWRFMMLEDVKETPAGYAVSKQLAETKGLTFEEVIQS